MAQCRDELRFLVALGGRAVHVPAPLTWVHDESESTASGVYRVLDRIDRLPDYLRELESTGPAKPDETPNPA